MRLQQNRGSNNPRPQVSPISPSLSLSLLAVLRRTVSITVFPSCCRTFLQDVTFLLMLPRGFSPRTCQRFRRGETAETTISTAQLAERC